METKYVRVPFDVEMAKKITNGEVEGRVVTRDGKKARIVCWDKIDEYSPIIALFEYDKKEVIETFMIDGRWSCDDEGEVSNLDLFLEVPEYMTYKDGDVLISSDGNPFIYKNISNGYISAYYGITDVGNEVFDSRNFTSLIKGKANEAQRKVIIDALKASKQPVAKEYLKRFFNIEVKPECEFKPKDWILIRDNSEDMWCLDIYSHKVWDKDEKCYHYYCVGGWSYQCIPYNDQTKHLLGTNDNWEE